MDYNKLDKRDLHVEKAIGNMIGDWDLDTLITHVFEERLDYYLEHADDKEVNELLKEFG